MERHEVLEMMAALKLAGMRDAFDEVLADGLKRQHPMQRIIGELLKAEIADKQARSIKYQMSGAKLPLAKELADFDFTDTPVNEPLVRELAVGGFLANQRNAVLTEAKVDWQHMMFGHASHSFCDVGVNNEIQRYDEKLCKQSYRMMRDFFSEIF